MHCRFAAVIATCLGAASLTAAAPMRGSTLSSRASRPLQVRQAGMRAGRGPTARALDAPNYLVIQVDDQAENSFTPRFMPDTFRSIVDDGTLFRNGLAAPPLCCPDRAGVLTGDYPHDSGVFSNDPGYVDLRGKRNTLAVWLSRAGYSTALIGKYLNRYSLNEGLRPAPGWDEWFSPVGPDYFGFKVSDNGAEERFGSTRHDYSSDVYTRRAIHFVRGRAGSSAPYFLWLTYNAPHSTRDPGRRCGEHQPEPPDLGAYERFAHVPLPRPPSYNERDVSDKPRLIRALPSIGRKKRRVIVKYWHCTLATVGALDHDIGAVIQAVRATSELERTIVIYLSDNGYYFGEHRIALGKQYPYEPALRVPFAVRVPGRYRIGRQPRSSDEVVSNEDIAPTLLDYAGGIPACRRGGRCRRLDGRSMAPLLGSGGRWPSDRGVLAELRASRSGYAAVRTEDWVFVKYRDGERELYSLKDDPTELTNLAGEAGYRAIQADLATRLARLRHCSGARGVVRPERGRALCE
jgi:N-acetylglucosamine-6-sulfatase